MMSDETELIRRISAYDEKTIRWLFSTYYSQMLRIARRFVRSVEEAEDVIQETWMAALTGIHGFRARSSFKTWIFRILFNIARRRGRREARHLPFSQLSATDALERIRARENPELDMINGEVRGFIDEAVTSLPPAQRRVFVAADVDGKSSAEVCAEFDLSAANQRVLLHRGRSRLREYLAPRLGVSLVA